MIQPCNKTLTKMAISAWTHLFTVLGLWLLIILATAIVGASLISLVRLIKACNLPWIRGQIVRKRSSLKT